MRRTSFAKMSCSIARTLELVGDWWTFLIVREAFFGSRKFGEFEKALGIAPNVLTQRLVKLVEGGILVVEASSVSGKALSYRLSPKGRDLFPVLVAMLQWGDQHASAPKGPPVRIVERRTGQEIAPMRLRSASGEALDVSEVMPVPGPGAGQAVRRRLLQIAETAEARRAGEG